MLRRIDLATNRFVDPSLEVGRGIGGGMIVEGGIAWLVGAQTRHVVVGGSESDYVSLTQVVLDSGAIQHIELDGWSSGAPALADGYLWVGLQKIDERNPREILSSIVKIDPRTLKMVAKVDVPNLGGAVAGSPEAVYATSYAGGGDLRPRVVRIDTATLATRETVLPPESGGLQIGGGSLWVLDFLGNGVLKLDPATLEVRGRISTGDRPGGMRVGAGSLWVAHSGDGTLARIDLE